MAALSVPDKSRHIYDFHLLVLYCVVRSKSNIRIGGYEMHQKETASILLHAVLTQLTHSVATWHTGSVELFVVVTIVFWHAVL
jgi:hypothetical protein